MLPILLPQAHGASKHASKSHIFAKKYWSAVGSQSNWQGFINCLDHGQFLGFSAGGLWDVSRSGSYAAGVRCGSWAIETTICTHLVICTIPDRWFQHASNCFNPSPRHEIYESQLGIIIPNGNGKHKDLNQPDTLCNASQHKQLVPPNATADLCKHQWRAPSTALFSSFLHFSWPEASPLVLLMRWPSLFLHSTILLTPRKSSIEESVLETCTFAPLPCLLSGMPRSHLTLYDPQLGRSSVPRGWEFSAGWIDSVLPGLPGKRPPDRCRPRELKELLKQGPGRQYHRRGTWEGCLVFWLWKNMNRIGRIQ